MHNLLPYRDNRKIMKFEYHSPSINNECKIVFDTYELKTNAVVRVMWTIFFYFETKVPLELKVMISRLVGDIVKMLKYPPGY